MELIVPSAVGIIILVLTLLSLGLWIFAVIDLVKGRFRDRTEKIVWILVILFIPLLGSILYFIIGRKNKIKEN